MTPEEIAAKEAATAAAKKTADEAAKKAAEDAKNTPDPLQLEREKIERENGTRGKTKLEKAQYTLKQVAKSVRLLGGVPQLEDESVFVDEEIPSEDDAPVTVGMLKKIEREKSAQTALSLAEDIEDENERELVKHHLETSIKPSGNPQEDLRKARAIVNEVKNKQIGEEITRKVSPRTTARGGGAPAKPGEKEFIPTSEEAGFMKPPFKLTKDQIIAARKKAQGQEE